MNYDERRALEAAARGDLRIGYPLGRDKAPLVFVQNDFAVTATTYRALVYEHYIVRTIGSPILTISNRGRAALETT